MELAEKIRRIQEKVGKPCTLAQYGPGTDPQGNHIQDIGDTAIIHIPVDGNAKNIQLGETEAAAWERAYFFVFGHPSFNDDPIDVQAQSIIDVWTRKGFKKGDGNSKHPVEAALYYLSIVVMAPTAYGAPSCFERGKNLILAHCVINEKK